MLCDDIVIRDAPAGITIESADPNVPCNQHNTVWKAAELLKERFNVDRGVKFWMVKRIPIGGGMGGGSADGAAALLGLNRFWQLGLSLDETARTGRRDRDGRAVLHPRRHGAGDRARRTREASAVAAAVPRRHRQSRHPRLDAEGLRKPRPGVDSRSPTRARSSSTPSRRDDRDAIIASLHNDFESAILDQYPVIGEIKQRLLDAGMSGALLSGSGASVFGIAQTEAQALAAVEALKYDYPFVVATQTRLRTYRLPGNPGSVPNPGQVHCKSCQSCLKRR